MVEDSTLHASIHKPHAIHIKHQQKLILQILSPHILSDFDRPFVCAIVFVNISALQEIIPNQWPTPAPLNQK